MGRNPVLWLACRERWQSVLVWALAVSILIGFIYMLMSDLPSGVWAAWSYVGGGLTLLFYLGVSSQAGKFFVEARRNGLIELLLAAPLPVKEIAQGHWRALLRMFGLPVAIFLCLSLAAGTLSHQAWASAMSGMRVTPHLAVVVGSAVIGTLVTMANLVALSWFGMWMGMTSKSANLATLKTLVFVQIVPWFVIHFASGILLWLLMMKMMLPMFTKGTSPNPGNGMLWYPFLNVVLTGVLSLGKDVFFTIWARQKLFLNFRDAAAQAVAPIRLVRSPTPAPPLISRPIGDAK